MSAFCDIWIGNAQLPEPRTGNKSWQEVSKHVYVSLPQRGEAFFRQYVSDSHTLVLIGQLYETVTDEELLDRYIRYTAHCNDSFNEPAGHYIVFLQDKDKKQTFVFTNRYGSYHAYWSADKVISTRYMQLAKSKANKKPDWWGINGFMATGYFHADTTWLEGIKIFEPASVYCFDEQLNLLNKKRYWNWTYSPVRQSQEYFAEHLHTELQKTIAAACSGKNVCMPISGGLDSRMLAGELTTVDTASVHGLSYGYTASSPETRIARQIADAINIPVHDYVMPDYLFGQLDEIKDAVELFQYIDGTRQASAVGWLNKNADVVVGGHWGDVWMDSINVDNGLEDAFRKKIIKKGSDWLIENICNSHLKDGKQVATNYFNSFMGQYSHIEDDAYRMKIYKTDQWSFRWTTASIRMYQAGAFPVLPFYDKNVADVLLSIPQAMLVEREFQVAYIKHYYPQLAKVTWQEYDANLYSYKQFNNRNLAYRVVDKIKRTVSQQPTIQRNWEVFYLNEQGRKKLENLLLNSKALMEFVPREKVEELIDNLYKKPDAANGYTVSMLLTFTLFFNEIL